MIYLYLYTYIYNLNINSAYRSEYFGIFLVAVRILIMKLLTKVIFYVNVHSFLKLNYEFDMKITIKE